MGEQENPPEEIPPEVEKVWEWLKANWVIVVIGIVIFAVFMAIIRGRR